MLCGASVLCKLCISRLISVTLIIASKVDNIIIVSRWSKLICSIINIISAELCCVVWRAEETLCVVQIIMKESLWVELMPGLQWKCPNTIYKINTEHLRKGLKVFSHCVLCCVTVWNTLQIHILRAFLSFNPVVQKEQS